MEIVAIVFAKRVGVKVEEKNKPVWQKAIHLKWSSLRTSGRLLSFNNLSMLRLGFKHQIFRMHGECSNWWRLRGGTSTMNWSERHTAHYLNIGRWSSRSIWGHSYCGGWKGPLLRAALQLHIIFFRNKIALINKNRLKHLIFRLHQFIDINFIFSMSKLFLFIFVELTTKI